jgi:hypothetical protein
MSEHYRCYFLDPKGHILSSQNIIAETEEEALSTARDSYSARAHHDGFELWGGTRKLHVVDRSDGKV